MVHNIVPPFERKVALPMGDKAIVKRTVGLSIDKRQLVQLMGIHNYASGLANVVLKEFIQNAFDAVRSAYQKAELPFGRGEIEIYIDPRLRKLAVRDNGVGMSPDTVEHIFLRVGSSLKEALAEDQKSGGFGLAKLAFLFAGDEIALRTVQRGRLTELRTTGQKLLSGLSELIIQRTDKPNGTVIQVILPDAVDMGSGEKRLVSFPRNVETCRVLHQPLLGNVKVTAHMDGKDPVVLPVGKHYAYNKTPLAAVVRTSWGKVDIYMSEKALPAREQTKAVLSAGLHQFTLNMLADIPYSVIMNVKSSVEADAPNYPFNKQREGWSVAVGDDLAGLKGIVSVIRNIRDSLNIINAFSAIKQIERSSHDDRVLYWLSDMPDLGSPYLQNPFQHTIQLSLKDRKCTCHYPNDSLVRDSFEGRYKIGSLPQIQTNKAVFHNALNINPLLEISRHTGQSRAVIMECMGDFAYITREYFDKLLDIPLLHGVRESIPFFGIQFSKQFRGLNVVMPHYAVALVNPNREMGQSPAALAHGWVHTMLHETVHWKVRPHDEAFAYLTSDLYSVMDDTHPGLYDQTRRRLERLATKHMPIFMALRKIISSPDVYDRHSVFCGGEGRRADRAQPKQAENAQPRLG